MNPLRHQREVETVVASCANGFFVSDAVPGVTERQSLSGSKPSETGQRFSNPTLAELTPFLDPTNVNNDYRARDGAVSHRQEPAGSGVPTCHHPLSPQRRVASS